jgi:hypothetical protein
MVSKSATLVFFCLAALIPAAEKTRKPRYLFETPIYPETEIISSAPQEFSTLELPFVTVEKIFKTRDGKSLDAEAVLEFYRKQLLAKGWASSGGSIKGEHHLRMRVNVGEDLPDRTHIQLGGDFYLLIAPKDGLLITFMRQWRHSNTDQVTSTRRSQILARLDVLAQRLNYRKSKVYSGGPWESHFSDEYIIDWEMFSLWDNAAKNATDINPIGEVNLQLMTYRDADIASVEQQRYLDQDKPLRQGTYVHLPVSRPGFREIIRKEKILIIIENPGADRQEIVKKLASGLREA